MEAGKAWLLHLRVTLPPKWAPSSWLGTSIIGGTGKHMILWVVLIIVFPTLHPEVHPLADGGRHPVARYAEVRPDVPAPHWVEHQGRAAHTCSWKYPRLVREGIQNYQEVYFRNCSQTTCILYSGKFWPSLQLNCTFTIVLMLNSKKIHHKKIKSR